MNINYIFIFLTLLLLFYLLKFTNNNIEYFSNKKFSFDLDNFNKHFEKNYLNKKEIISEEYIDLDTKFHKIPFKKNSVKISEFEDEGILKNFRPVKEINSYSQEISYQDLKKIIDEIMKIREYNIYFKGSILNIKLKEKIYKSIIDVFIEQVNINLKKMDLEIEHHKFEKRKFKYKNHNIILDKVIDDKTVDNRNLVFTLFIFRRDKFLYYSIQIDCNYNYIFKKIIFNQIDITGIIEQDKITFTKYLNNKPKFCDINKDNKDDSCFPNLNPDYKSLKEYEKYFNNEIVPEFINTKKKEKEYHDEYKKNKCFLRKGFNESICKSYSTEKQTHGVWDKPCKKNNECPFYKKNKNYDNTRGGCNNGYCEMPINVERVGYKYYKTDKKPFCHNCDLKDCMGEDCFTCCDLQKNRELYFNLKGPDYIFKNDGR